MTGSLAAASRWQARDMLSRRRMTVGSMALLAAVSGWLTAHDSSLQAATQWISDICSSGPILSSTAILAGTGRPASQVQPLSCEPLADVPGKSVTTALVTFPPQAYSPAHRHPGSVTAFVVSGSIRSQLEGAPARVYAAGTTWFEPAGALHLFAENPSPSDAAQLLAVFITDHDCGPLVIPEPPHSTHPIDK